MDFSELRTDYEQATLDESEVDPLPHRQLERWVTQALDAGVPEAHSMVLCTVGAGGIPSARNLLMRGLSEAGLDFYTNRDSRKGVELAANPAATAVFSWLGLQRQIRVTGRVVELSDAESDRYFATRPRGSQIGAWVSAQSSVISSRAALEADLAEVTGRFGDGPIPRPPRWGGYRLAPFEFEFWQGRRFRLHDRLRYTQIDCDPARWTVARLAP